MTKTTIPNPRAVSGDDTRIVSGGPIIFIIF